MSMPVTNVGPRRHARTRHASSARMNVSACHANVWSSVPKLYPGTYGTSKRRRNENTKGRRGQGNEGGGADERRGGRYRCAQEVKGKGKYRAKNTPLLLP